MIKIRNKKLLLTICSILVVGIGAVGLTKSFFISKDEVVNIFKTGEVEIENKEDFDPNPSSDGEVKKVVSIKNVTQNNPSLVRVNITPRWVEVKDGKEIPWSGDVSEKIVHLNFSDNVISEITNSSWPENKWLKGNDGYYYYTSILPANTESSEILKSLTITLKDEYGNDLVENPSEYEGKTLIVDVNSEAIQPTQQAYIDSWGVTDQNIVNLLDSLLGITQ